MFLSAALALAFVRDLPHVETPIGSRIRFLGVVNPYSGNAWDGEGRPLKSFLRLPSDPQYPPLKGVNRKEFARFSSSRSFRFLCEAGPGVRTEPTFEVRPAFAPLSHAAATIGKGRWVYHCDASYDGPAQIPASVAFRLGVADGPWQSLGSQAMPRGKSVGLPFHPIVREPTPNEGFMKDQCFVEVRLPSRYADYAVEGIAYDRRGRRLPVGSATSTTAKGTLQSFSFRGKPSDVARVELRARPYTWLPLKVRLARGG